MTNVCRYGFPNVDVEARGKLGLAGIGGILRDESFKSLCKHLGPVGIGA